MKLTFETGGALFGRSAVAKPGHAEMLRKESERTGRLPISDGRTVKMHRFKKRMYDAAATTNLNGDFPVSIASANAEILVSISATRSRARRLVRDNPYATGIENNNITNVCGDEPFRLEMKVGKKVNGKFVEENDTNEIIEKAWKEAGRRENCTTRRNMTRSEWYWMCIAAVERDGGVLNRHRRLYPKNKFLYAIEPVEIDRLDHYWNRPNASGVNEIQFSIELDEWRAPVAYWLLTRHPGDVFAYSNQDAYRERVVADDIIEFFNLRLRAEQYVGMSQFSSVIQRLHRIDQYDIAEMTAAITCAIKIGFFTKTNTSDQYVGDVETEDGMKIDRAEPGLNFEEMPDNFDLKQFDPKHPVEAYAAFTDQNLRAVARGTGQAHSSVSGNYAGMSFSTGRLEKAPEKDAYKMKQEHMKKNLVHPHFNEWLKYAILSRSVALPISRLQEFQDAAHFHAKRWEYINPLEDVQADVLRVQHGFDSRSNIIAESARGGDVELVDGEQASDKEVDEAHGLDFTNIDPTKPNVAKPPGENNDDNAPTAESKAGTKQTIKRNGHRFANIN